MQASLSRRAGVLLPVSSLPSPYGIGTLGKAAYEFIDQLHEAKQTYWQVLPVGPTSYGDSPYQSYSTFAGNPYFIDLDTLVEEGLLNKEDLEGIVWCTTPQYIDYDKIYENRYTILKKAFLASDHMETEEYTDFLRENEFWLNDYALFMAIKDSLNGASWQTWEKPLKTKDPATMEEQKVLLKDSIDFYCFLQYKFYEQWHQVKEYANELDIQIIGDIPIYVALDSADIWSHPEQFQLDEDLTPTLVAGCPPDAFSDWGQKWGNPLYDWEKMELDDFSWWKKRMKASTKLYDVIRIDHFIGIVRYFRIPLDGMPKDGAYKEGPGMKLIRAIDSVLGDAKVIAEDLGVVVPAVKALIEESGYPGMKVLHFAFDGSTNNDYLPHNHVKNSVAYLGTHDNETTLGLLSTASEWSIGFMKAYLGVETVEEIPDAMIRTLYMSSADTVILTMQDILKKDNTARINFPSTLGNNWKWRMQKNEFTKEMIRSLSHLTSIYGRNKTTWYEPKAK